MAFNGLNFARSFFSVFKKKVMPLRTGDNRTAEQLYTSLSTFESQLSDLELKKMPKMLQSFSRKFRRLLKQNQHKTINVPMQLSHTFESYTRNVDELIFGSEQAQLQTNLQQIVVMTDQMINHDLNTYLISLIPLAQSHSSLYLRIEQRFINIEQRISRQIYSGYFGFSKTVSKIAFLQQRQYKGDFKFKLIEDVPKIELAIDGIYNCALFNKCRDKLALACELAMTNLLEKIKNQSLAKLLFCLANSARSLKYIQENFHAIRQRIGDMYPLELLYYMLMSGLEDSVWFHMISNQLVIAPKNAHEQSIAKMIQIILKERFECFIQVQERDEFARKATKHQGQIFFENFLQRLGYQYTQTPFSLFPYTVYCIQGKKFLCYDNFSIKDESFSLSGPGLIITQYFHDRSQGMKHINWPRMLTMEKRGERDEYILSKFKGIQKPKRVKVRYYE